MSIIDSHTHLYLNDFENDIDDVIQRAIDAGIEKFYMPAIDSTTNESMLLIENKYPGKCYAMMGLHPCSVKENYNEELNHVYSWLQKKQFAAIGETGLDFYWDKTFVAEQYKSFEQQIEWALQFNLPIVMHTRNSIQEAIDVARNYISKGLRGIFHCFSGSYQNAVEIIEADFLLGIGGVITYKNAGLGEIIKKIGLNNVVLETDAPYLAPVPFRGKRNESSYIKYVVKKLAEILNVTEEEVETKTTANAKKIFAV